MNYFNYCLAIEAEERETIVPEPEQQEEYYWFDIHLLPWGFIKERGLRGAIKPCPLGQGYMDSPE